MKKKRVFAVEEKMQILWEAEQNSMLVTCRKHEIAQSIYYHWKNKFDYINEIFVTSENQKILLN